MMASSATGTITTNRGPLLEYEALSFYPREFEAALAPLAELTESRKSFSVDIFCEVVGNVCIYARGRMKLRFRGSFLSPFDLFAFASILFTYWVHRRAWLQN